MPTFDRSNIGPKGFLHGVEREEAKQTAKRQADIEYQDKALDVATKRQEFKEFMGNIKNRAQVHDMDLKQMQMETVDMEMDIQLKKETMALNKKAAELKVEGLQVDIENAKQQMELAETEEERATAKHKWEKLQAEVDRLYTQAQTNKIKAETEGEGAEDSLTTGGQTDVVKTTNDMLVDANSKYTINRKISRNFQRAYELLGAFDTNGDGLWNDGQVDTGALFQVKQFVVGILEDLSPVELKDSQIAEVYNLSSAQELAGLVDNMTANFVVSGGRAISDGDRELLSGAFINTRYTNEANIQRMRYIGATMFLDNMKYQSIRNGWNTTKNIDPSKDYWYYEQQHEKLWGTVKDLVGVDPNNKVITIDEFYQKKLEQGEMDDAAIINEWNTFYTSSVHR